MGGLEGFRIFGPPQHFVIGLINVNTNNNSLISTNRQVASQSCPYSYNHALVLIRPQRIHDIDTVTTIYVPLRTIT